MEKRLRFWRKKSKQQETMAPLKEAIEPSETMDNNLSKELKTNQQVLKDTFRNCSDIIFRELTLDDGVDALLIFVDGMVKSAEIHENALQPLLFKLAKTGVSDITPDIVEDSVLSLSQVSHVNLYSEVVENVLTGNATLLINGYSEALVLNVRGGTRRSVEEPETEKVIRGPREGFTENLRTNTGLIRFKVKSPRLKTVAMTIGEHTRTNVVLAYMEGIADSKVIDEVKNRLESIHIDGVLESAYIEELIEDQPYSPFPQLQNTERPDTVAAQLLEGRFAIFVDGTPFVLLGPITFWQMLQASDDYYERYMMVSLIRLFRYLFLNLALFLPALYIAVTTFHQDMLPTSLLLSVAAARETIPFPAIVEALIMEVSFEALREAGIRLPKGVGQTVSILGAIVIGQAAVQAGIVSAPMVIVVAMTGIASFTIPRYNQAIAIRLLRFPLMFLAATFGLLGIVLGFVWIAVHLCNLRSFGVPYLSGVAPLKTDELKDIFVRAPWWKMELRPTSFSHRDRKRMGKQMKPSPPRSAR
ncbi:putative membrane protein YfkQ [Effusibacillus dendaii]|uniref:Putative membrane protein YfkQ n=2 Tax=Effusibacillus dendaii TaxID=2743772 RepID=A0A7I8DBI1_9BACL|nr:putative membrane protein YfkQ [Effusibacillus dendaii]